MESQTIDQAIAMMDEIIDASRRANCRAGYFAAMYRKVTLQIRDNIHAGYFQDNPRMETFDVLFANRYLKAWWQWSRGKQTTQVWEIAFNATKDWRPVVVQHLFLGMNAHINLDLGIAAARTAAVSGTSMASLQPDFNKINEVLAGLVDSVIAELSEIWWPLRVLEHLQADDIIVNFSMEKARDSAWSFAEQLAPLSIAQQEDDIRDKDFSMSLLARQIASPALPLQAALLPVRLSERGSVAEKIDILASPAGQMRQSGFSLLLNA